MFANGPSPRIIKETSNMLNNPIEGVDFSQDPNNFRHFWVNLQGFASDMQDKLERFMKADYSR